MASRPLPLLALLLSLLAAAAPAHAFLDSLFGEKQEKCVFYELNGKLVQEKIKALVPGKGKDVPPKVVRECRGGTAWQLLKIGTGAPIEGSTGCRVSLCAGSLAEIKAEDDRCVMYSLRGKLVEERLLRITDGKKSQVRECRNGAAFALSALSGTVYVIEGSADCVETACTKEGKEAALKEVETTKQAEEASRKSAEKAGGKIEAELAKPGSLGGAAAVSKAKGRSEKEVQMELDKTFTGKNYASSPKLFPDSEGDQKKKGATQLKEGAEQGGGSLRAPGSAHEGSGRGDAKKAPPALEEAAAKPEDGAGMSTLKKVGVGAAAVALGGLGLLLGGASRAEAAEPPSAEEAAREADARASRARNDAAHNFGKLNPSAEDQRKFADFMKSRVSNDARTEALVKFNELSDGQKRYLLRQLHDGYEFEQALTDAQAKSSLL